MPRSYSRKGFSRHTSLQQRDTTKLVLKISATAGFSNNRNISFAIRPIFNLVTSPTFLSFAQCYDSFRVSRVNVKMMPEVLTVAAGAPKVDRSRFTYRWVRDGRATNCRFNVFSESGVTVNNDDGITTYTMFEPGIDMALYNWSSENYSNIQNAQSSVTKFLDYNAGSQSISSSIYASSIMEKSRYVYTNELMSRVRRFHINDPESDKNNNLPAADTNRQDADSIDSYLDDASDFYPTFVVWTSG